MLAIGLLQWWYSRGWGIFIGKIGEKFRNIADFFSLGLLLKTLFAPFRQIGTNGAIGESRASAAIDKLISRIVGFFARLAIILAGILVLVLTTIVSVIAILVWPVLPFFPLICIGLTVMGVAL